MDSIGLLIQIIDTVISFTCIVFIFYRAKKSGIMVFETKLILLTQICFWFSCLSSLFLYFLPPLNSVDGKMTALLIGSPGMLSLLLGYFLYLLLVSRFSAEQPGLITFFVAAAMFGGAIFLALSGVLSFEYILAIDKWTMAADSFWFIFLVGAMGYYVGFYALIQLRRMYRNSKHLNRQALRTFILASLFAFIAPNLVFSLQPPPGTPGVIQTPMSTNLPFIFLGIGVAMFCYAYLINPSLGFIVSHKIYRLIVVSSAGIPLYSASFEEDIAGSYSTDELIGGALTGITHLMEESIRGHVI